MLKPSRAQAHPFGNPSLSYQQLLCGQTSFVPAGARPSGLETKEVLRVWLLSTSDLCTRTSREWCWRTNVRRHLSHSALNPCAGCHWVLQLGAGSSYFRRR